MIASIHGTRLSLGWLSITLWGLLLASPELAHSTPSPAVERLLIDLDTAADQERSLIGALKASIAKKEAVEAEAETLQADSERYRAEVAEWSTFCVGMFDDAEVARRRAICTPKQRELDARHATLSQRQELIDGKRSTQRQEAAALAASSTELRARAQAIQDRLSALPVFAPIGTDCRGLRGIGEVRDCLRASWAKASSVPMPSAKGAATNIALFCTAKLRVAADERAIQQLNLSNDVRSFEMYADVSAAQKAKLQKKVADALLSQAMAASTMASMSAKSLNPYNVNNTIKQLRANGLDNDAIFAGLRKIAATKDKPAMAAAYKELVNDVRNAKQGYDTGKAVAEDEQNARLQLLLGVLKVAQGNPTLGLVITATGFGESLAYLGYVSAEVDDLTRVTEHKLLLLNDYVTRLKQDVHALKAARRDLATVNGIHDEPGCHR
jgi:hypothetical protein